MVNHTRIILDSFLSPLFYFFSHGPLCPSASVPFNLLILPPPPLPPMPIFCGHTILLHRA